MSCDRTYQHPSGQRLLLIYIDIEKKSLTISSLLLLYKIQGFFLDLCAVKSVQGALCVKRECKFFNRGSRQNPSTVSLISIFRPFNANKALVFFRSIWQNAHRFLLESLQPLIHCNNCALFHDFLILLPFFTIKEQFLQCNAPPPSLC